MGVMSVLRRLPLGLFHNAIKGLAMATVAFSHFYKIPLVPKVTKSTFYSISSSLLMISF